LFGSGGIKRGKVNESITILREKELSGGKMKTFKQTISYHRFEGLNL